MAVLLLTALWGIGRTLASIGIYMTLGAIGLPVFAGFGGGLGVLIGPGGGYLMGLVPMVLLCGILLRVLPIRTWTIALSMMIGQIGCYMVGCGYFVFVYLHGETVEIGSAILQGVLPFLIPDAIKIAVSVPVAARYRKSRIFT